METISAIAPGWVIVALLALLAVAIGWAFLEGHQEQDQIERMLTPLDEFEPQTVYVRPRPYDWEIDEMEGGGVR